MSRLAFTWTRSVLRSTSSAKSYAVPITFDFQRIYQKSFSTVSNSDIKKLTTPSDILSTSDVFIFDCDGVIWRGDTLIPKASKIIDRLREQGKKLFFVTNNSTKSRAGFLSKFTNLGLNVYQEGILSITLTIFKMIK